MPSESLDSELFPLPLTSIEKFHWLDHDSEYPNYIFAQLRFEQAIACQPAQQAWDMVVQRHPLGGVLPEKVSGRWQWKQTPTAAGNASESHEFQFHSPTEPWTVGDVDLPNLDIGTRPWLSVRVWPERTASEVTPRSQVCFCIHHAISDGVGAIHAITEWLIIYNNLIVGRPPGLGLNRVDAKEIAKRNQLGLTRWSYLRQLYKQPIALFGASKFIFRRTGQLYPNAAGGHQDRRPNTSKTVPVSSASRVIGRWLDADRTKDLYDFAAKLEVTTNTVLLANLFRVLSAFRRKHAGDDSPGSLDREWLRVILPISIRSMRDRRLPVSNRTTLVQIDRQQPPSPISQEYMQLLQREINIIRRWQLDRTFLIAIRALALSDRLLQKSAQNPKSRGLAVFTDLGRPFKKATKTIQRLEGKKLSPQSAAENRPDEPVIPVDFDFAGPIRRGTALNLAVARMGKRIRVSLHYDQTVIEAASADALLDDYLEGLPDGIASSSA